MTTRPYELLARFDKTGKIAGVSVRTITTIDGKDYESDPMPLGQLDKSDEWKNFVKDFAAKAIVERDETKTEHTTAKDELRDTKTERNSLRDDKQRLQSRIDKLLSDKEADATKHQDTLLTVLTELSAEKEQAATKIAALQSIIDNKQAKIDELRTELSEINELVEHPNLKQLKRQRARAQAALEVAAAIKRKEELDAEIE